MRTNPPAIDVLEQHTPRTHGRRRLGRPIVIGCLILISVAIRTIHLDSLPFWVDEAESSINALTILQRGYPADHYLGLPIYENTNVWSWPESSEYEFRDVSYSHERVAVYHGWLPLYAIAASFWLHGITADEVDGSRVVKHNLSEQKRRTRAARLPAVFFSVIFLLAVFLGGAALYRPEAGWAALIVGVIYPTHLSVSDQARYYSAQVTLTTVCCILLWLLVRECKWKHVLLAALAYVLLFHTHLLSFLTAAIMAVLCMPVVAFRHKDWRRKLSVFATLVSCGALPWVFFTGFYAHQGRIPRAWPLLQLPSDLLRYAPFDLRYGIAGLALGAIAFWLQKSGRRDAALVRGSAQPLMSLLALLGGWSVVGYFSFLFFIPAVSFTQSRLNLSYWGPLFLLFAIVCTAVARILVPRLRSNLTTLLAVLMMLGVSTAVRSSAAPLQLNNIRHTFGFGHRPGDESWRIVTSVLSQIDALNLDSHTKLYASPNKHLILTIYSGIPVQDITPLRKSYLNSYPGDIVYIDWGVSHYTDLLAPERVRRAAVESGLSYTPDEAYETSVLLLTRPYREVMTQAFAPDKIVQLEPMPPFAESLLREHQDSVRSYFTTFGYEVVTRGFEVETWSEWIGVMKYRFADPPSRIGARANYVERLRSADAYMISGAIAIFRSRWHPPISSAPLHFKYLN